MVCNSLHWARVRHKNLSKGIINSQRFTISINWNGIRCCTLRRKTTTKENMMRTNKKRKKNNGKKCLPSSIILSVSVSRYSCLCSASSFVNIKYKWAFHRILYRTRQYNTTQYNTLHTHSPTHQLTHTEIHHNKGVGTAHSFLKYKWAVNNVMMLSGSIYSYMICWLGFYLYGPFFCIPWYGQFSYYTINNTTPHNNCYTLFRAGCSRIHFHELEHHVNV